MLGTHPDCKDRGVGTQLKLLQKQRLKDKVPLITWTFDPLESRNAHLNFNKLGIRVRRYYCSLYGDNPTSSLHSGIGTDRFLAEWWINASKHQPGRHSKASKISWALRGKSFESKFRVPDEPRFNLEDRVLQVEIPGNIQALKRSFPEVAHLWREKTRIVLTHYLQNRYQVTGFESVLDRSQSRISFYQIEKISESSEMKESAWESEVPALVIPGKIP
jgi:predicted GNAT superfamily acetyltransferase